MIRVAVTYENGNVFQHFGHSEKFKIYDVEDGHIVKADVIDTNGQGHGALVGFLQAQEVNAVIAGGIGVFVSRSAIPNAFRCATRPRRAISVTMPALRPASTSACMAASSSA